MDNKEILSMTAVELGKKIKAGEVSVAEAVKTTLQRINEVEKDINSYVTVLDEADILKRAEEVQNAIDAGELTHPLAGVPVAMP